MSFRMRNSNVDIVKAGPTLIEQAYDAILAAICDGRLAPGAPAEPGRPRRAHGDLAAARRTGAVGPQGAELRAGYRPARADRRAARAGIPPLPSTIARGARLAWREPRRAALHASGLPRKEGSWSRTAAKPRNPGASTRDSRRTCASTFWIMPLAGNPLLAETMRLYWIPSAPRGWRRCCAIPATVRRSGTSTTRILEAIVANDAAEPPTAPRRMRGRPARRWPDRSQRRTLARARPARRGALR